MASRIRGLLERLLARRRVAQHDGVPDAELLKRFAHDRDEAAFELLVWRHGAMVLGLCRRAVRDEQLAEDAFQAVFLVLARKAGAVRGNLGGWLFKVARRVSLRAVARRPVTQSEIETAAPQQPDSAEQGELSSLLDAEIAGLPDRLRRPVILCYLGGHSTEDAARELGCPRGTVLSRLAAARKRLAERLTRRGVTLPAALAGTTLSGRLVSQASASAVAFRTGLFTASTATLLANGVLHTMSRITLLTALGAVVLAASLVGGVGWITFGPRPNASVAADAPADPPRPAPDAPKVGKPDPDDRRRGEERRQADERRKKLEQFAETLRVEVEALEKNIELLVKASGDDAVRTALQKRLADLEAEITALNRDILRAEAEITVLKKRLDDKNPAPVDAAVLDQLVASDPAVVKAAGDLDKAKAELARALDMVVGKEPPLVGELKRAVERLEKELGERRRTAMQAGAVAARELERAALKRRIADLETTIEVKRAVLEKLKAERDALAKAVRLGADPAPDVQRMRDAIQPQRELLAKLQRELLLERARERGITFTEPAGNDAKLDLILKELAALRKEVQELKDRK